MLHSFNVKSVTEAQAPHGADPRLVGNQEGLTRGGLQGKEFLEIRVCEEGGLLTLGDPGDTGCAVLVLLKKDSVSASQ